MPKLESLDDLIAKKATEFADQVKAAAGAAANEEEIKIEVENQLAFIQRDAGVKLDRKHEFTVASGRVDSVYSRVIIEYKNPKSPGDRIGPKPDSPGTRKVVEQIKNRFFDLRKELGQPLKSLFGVGLDGNHFVFVRFRDDKWQVQDPVEVNRYSAERFLWALFNLGQKGKPFSPEYLAGDFGSEGGDTIAVSGIHALYGAILTTDNPKAQIFFSQWKLLFGEVCGYDVDNPSDKMKKLAESYHVRGKDLKPAELLFAVHTYYALFMKLLASEIVAFFHKLPTPLQKMMQATSSNKLRREMDDLEAGSVFRHLNITNFLEGDLFAWYTGVWSEPIERLVRDMVTKLDDYNPGTLSEDPAGSRDLLKKLYQQLFPKSVRHDLGEYYTPDWLAEHVLNELRYVGDPDKRLLDPACGSGTFLVMAINRIRAWYDENHERCRFDEGDLCRKILANVIGFDLNPLAVMAARTNYLIAIRDLIGRTDKIEIPVFLCDSILTPTEYGDLFTGKYGNARELRTAAARFLIPTEIATDRDDVGKYAEQLEFCVRNGYSPEEFVERCQDEGLPVSSHNLHTDLYSELVNLDKANRNGVWARIIKNAFAPLFVGRVDYIAGNPPWINWDALPENYRRETFPIWSKHHLFEHTGLRARLGSSEDDLSVLFVYTSIDAYLNPDGMLGFVITQSLFQSKGGGAGFRRFKLGDGRQFKVRKVSDMVALQPFEGATNRTAVVICQNGKETKYPLPYTVWQKTGNVDSSATLAQVEANTVRYERIASPVDSADLTSPWLVVEQAAHTILSRVLGKSTYRARVGVHTVGANGVYWVNIPPQPPKSTCLVENCGDVGKRKVPSVRHRIETELLFPLVRGRELHKWHFASSLYVLLPQDPDKLASALTEGVLKRKYPETYEYLLGFKRELGNRKSNIIKQLMRDVAFYSIYAVGPYTYAPWKVAWREISSGMEAAVVGTIESQVLGRKPAILDHKLTFVDCQTAKEAHYLCAMLNSRLVGAAIDAYVVSTQVSTHVLNYIAVPTYRPGDRGHMRLAELSQQCHATLAKDKNSDVSLFESEIDAIVPRMFGVSSEENALIAGATSLRAPHLRHNHVGDD